MNRLGLGTIVMAAAVATAAGAWALELEDPAEGGPQSVLVQAAGTTTLADMLNFEAQWTAPATPTFSLFDDRRIFSVIGSAALTDTLSAGVRLEFDDQAAGTADRATVYAAGSFGRFEYGSTQTATDALHIQGTSVLAGGGSRYDRTGEGFWSPLMGFGRVSRRGPNMSDEEATVGYSSPSFGGLTVGVSYTHDTSSIRISDSMSLRFEDIVSLAGQYVASYGNTTATLYGGYENSNLLSHPHDIASVGGRLQRGGLAFAAGFGFEDAESGPVAFGQFMQGFSTAWADVGASYHRGNWTMSLGAAWADRKSASFDGEAGSLEDYALSSGLNYNLTAGVVLRGAMTHYRLRDPSSEAANAFMFETPDSAATTVSLAARVSF